MIAKNTPHNNTDKNENIESILMQKSAPRTLSVTRKTSRVYNGRLNDPHHSTGVAKNLESIFWRQQQQQTDRQTTDEQAPIGVHLPQNKQRSALASRARFARASRNKYRIVKLGMALTCKDMVCS